MGSIVFRGLSAQDPDSNVNGQVEFFIENESPFEIELPHQGIIRLANPLDYETQKVHLVTIVAKVMRSHHHQDVKLVPGDKLGRFRLIGIFF